MFDPAALSFGQRPRISATRAACIKHLLTLAKVQVMWRAPPSGSGCVIFTAMVLENNVRWYAEDGALTKTFCEMDSTEVEALDGEKCCACDEAKYSVSTNKINFIHFLRSIDSYSCRFSSR